MIELEFDPKLKQCPLCHSSEVKDHKKDFNGIHISLCQGCNIEFMNPQYTDDYLATFYAQYQREDSKHHRYGEKIKPRELVHEYNYKQIEGYIQPGKLLCVGCGNGLDVKVGLDRGWNAEGYEVGEKYTQELSKKLNTNIYHGDFTKLNPNKKYSCIYLNHVLEHPKNPGAYLDKIVELLCDNGLLYIACPNIDSFSNRLKTVMEKLGLKKSIGKHYDTWHHLFYYSPSKLKRLLEKEYGFEVLYTGNDKKAKATTTKVEHSFIDDIAYKSSFRLIARKIK